MTSGQLLAHNLCIARVTTDRPCKRISRQEPYHDVFISVARRDDGYASLYGCMLGMMAPVIYLARHARTASSSDHSAPPILDSNPAGSRRELARG